MLQNPKKTNNLKPEGVVTFPSSSDVLCFPSLRGFLGLQKLPNLRMFRSAKPRFPPLAFRAANVPRSMNDDWRGAHCRNLVQHMEKKKGP